MNGMQVEGHAVSKCPYPGPRPLDGHQSDLLVGRDLDIASLLRAVEGRNRAVIVHAPSGVGKSSLLMAGLVPPLTARGKTVVPFRNWSELGRDPLNALVQAFVGGFEEAAIARPELAVHAVALRGFMQDGGGLSDFFDAMDYLNAQFGQNLVLILDQMEEIFRLDRSFGLQFVDSLTQVLQPVEETQFKVVLSLRSEFASELEPLERRLLRDLWDSWSLAPVTSAQRIDDIVTLRRSDVAGWRFDDDLADQIVQRWTLAAFDTTEVPEVTSVPKVGLLHLQAALWVLWNRASAGAGPVGLERTVPRSTVVDAVTRSQGTTGVSVSSALRLCIPTDPESGAYWRDVFEGVLEEYVELSIQQHVDAAMSSPAQDRQLAQAIAAETKAQVARLAPQLSSGGYKIIADSDELARSAGIGALPPAAARYFLSVVRIAREQARSIFVEGQAERLEPQRLAEAIRVRCESDPDLKAIGDGLDVVDRQSSAGRLRACDATLAELAREMAVTHERAVRWLIDASVVRETPGLTNKQGSTRFLSVVHDGYGAALKRWGLRTLNELDSARYPLVAVRGDSPLENVAPDDSAGESDSPADPIEGVHFSNLVWQGCDVERRFVNVTFEDCDLRGLVFYNCDFTDVTFLNCCLYGTIWIDCRFGGTITISADREYDRPEIDRERQIRGLSFEQGCVFDPHAKLVFRELWGSGLSVTETTCTQWELDYCGLENVLVQLDAASEGARAHGVVRDCVIHNLTIGNALIQRGTDARNAAQIVRFEAERPGDQGGNIIRHLTLSPEASFEDLAKERNSIKFVWEDRRLTEGGGD